MIRRPKQLLFRPNLPPFIFTQRSTYVDVKMKWKKDPFFDTLDTVNRAKPLRTLLSLKTLIASDPNSSIPISAVSKQSRSLEVPGRVATFLRQYPAVFEEFTGPQHNLPWFRLTPEAAELHRMETTHFALHRSAVTDRLRRLIIMSKSHRLPTTIVQGMLFYLGLPENFLHNPEESSDGRLKIVEMDGEQWLSAALNPGEIILSTLQRGAMRDTGQLSQSPSPVVQFPLFPSKGLRLKHKIEQWVCEFQRLRYISPYEDSSGLDPGSDVSEKRAAGVLHELLCLFVDCSAERRKLLCLKKHLGLSQKFHKVFERHPHVFYLQLKNKTCTVVLKEAYCAGLETVVEPHPMLEVRKRYVRLMEKSEAIIRSRRSGLPRCKAADIGLGSNVNFDGREKSDSIEGEAVDIDRCQERDTCEPCSEDTKQVKVQGWTVGDRRTGKFQSSPEMVSGYKFL